MAQNANQLFASATGKGSQLRVEAKNIQAKAFAAGATALAPLTPVAFNTSTNLWVLFQNGGANGTDTIKGFIWPDAAPRHATEETLANVLIQGTIHLDDIPIVSGYTLAQLKAAIIASNVRALGIIVQGMENFY